MVNLTEWVKAARLRTLPLALTGICFGSAIAAQNNFFNLQIAIWAFVTAILLQVLSNFANDYGDFKNGADTQKDRVGPSRAVSAGTISAIQMKNAILLFSILSLISGIILLSIAFDSIFSIKFLLLFLLGLAAIGAAIFYTIGKKPYGYIGLGDISVFVFFGLVSVVGSYFLYSNNFEPRIVISSLYIACMSVAVLNLNNMRDIESDKAAGKNSIPVRIGLKNAKIYHSILVFVGVIALIIDSWLSPNFQQYFIPLIIAFTQLADLKKISKIEANKDFDPFLKITALKSFGVGLSLLITILYQ